MDVILGLDTSCYTTSAAAVDTQGRVVAFSRMLLPVSSGQRGLRQSEAVFAHVRQMPEVMAKLTAQLPPEAKMIAVCASGKPRDDEASYMPVFRVGEGCGQILADTLRVPFFRTSHQQGHIAAGKIGLPSLDERFVALHISGGTTDLLLWEGQRLTSLGSSLDLHAGQLVDRIGVKLGLRFPAGAEMEQLGQSWGQNTQALFPVGMENQDLCCHFSGAETKALGLIQHGDCSPEQIAAEMYDLLARTFARMLVAGCKSQGVRQALVVGGVASSALLREQLARRLERQRAPVDLLFGQREYSSDNAAGIAVLGLEQLLREQSKP